MIIFSAYQGRKWIDDFYINSGFTATEVRQKLIDMGYSKTIRVVRKGRL